MASRPRCETPCRAVAAVSPSNVQRTSDRAPAISGGAEGEHPLDVPSHGHQAPFATCLVEATQQKLAKSERRFDDAEHRFWDLFAQSIELPAFGRRQPM